MSYDIKAPKAAVPISEVLTKISPVLIKKIAEFKHPFTAAFLAKHKALQGVVGTLPVIAFPMHTGSYHCISYTTYKERAPRFINAPPFKLTKTGRKAKTRLGLLGLKASPIPDDKETDLPPLYLTEGIWDMLTLSLHGVQCWGVPGANNWNAKWEPMFTKRDVYIIYDNDEPGRKFSEIHARRLLPMAKSIKLLVIPEILKKKDIKDISDAATVLKKGFKEWLINLTETTEEFSINTAQMIDATIESKLSPTMKVSTIAEIIRADLTARGGIIIPFNRNQELAMVADGLSIAKDREIDILLGREYNYLPSMSLWKQVRETIYNSAIRRTDSIRIHSYSNYNPDTQTLYIGLKGKGLICVDRDGHYMSTQGTDGMYVDSQNSVELIEHEQDWPDTPPVVSTIEELIEVFNFDEEVLTSEEQVMLVKTWLYNSFFNFDTMQPILCATGDTGSGKSQLFKFLKGALFGFADKLSALNVIPEDQHEWSLMIKQYKYLFFDEVNENNAAIKKRLRTMATGIQEVYRPKYDKHNVDFIPDSWLAINGLNMISSREHDITKRLCIIRLSRLSLQGLTAKFGPEYIMNKRLEKARPVIWENMLETLSSIIYNLEANEDDIIQLEHPCRFMGLANFAYQAFPGERDLVVSCFEKMDKLQSHHSAETDPLLDIIEEWWETIAPAMNDGEGRTTPVRTKVLFRGMHTLAKEQGVKYFPHSEAALGRWLRTRESILIERFKYERYRNTKTKNWEHTFSVPETVTF